MATSTEEEEDPLEFEEWDGSSPFLHHCVAGSLAGVSEHVLVYPIDTVKTHIQCAACPAATSNTNNTNSASFKTTTASSSSSFNQVIGSGGEAGRSTTIKGSKMNMNSIPKGGGFLTTMKHIMSPPPPTPVPLTAGGSATTAIEKSSSSVGFSRLWRGVNTVLIGCIPAHALYFSSYEAVKYATLRPDGSLPYWGGLFAGAAAVIGHDIIMSPLDTIKQRLQLGHYPGLRQAALHMIQHEGTFSLYRSFPITLLTNIPYGSIMVSTNEICKDYLSRNYDSSSRSHNGGGTPSLSVCLLSSSMGGMVASFVTTPLDRIKTMLQIQRLQPAKCERFGVCPKAMEALSEPRLEWNQIVRQILRQEGVRGLFKGSLPRILSHTPAVAISWTTYESAKQWLSKI